MTIDWWTLALQAINVLILVWLLSRVFWRPVAKAIAKRQEMAASTMETAKAAAAKAEATLAEVTQARAGIAAERETLLAAATAEAEAAKEAATKAAEETAGKLANATKAAQQRENETARAERSALAAALSLDIAAKLLARLDPAIAQAAFQTTLIKAIAAMPAQDRTTLAATQSGIDLVSAVELDADDAAKITKAVTSALGGKVKLNFVTDAELIAGLEIRTAHFVLHNSWRSDLAQIRKDLKNVA